MVILTTLGKKLLLSRIVNNIEAEDFVLHLYSNNYNPKKSSTVSSFKEVHAPGYKPRTMWGLFWEVKRSKVEAVDELFTFEGKAGKIIGFYITTSGVLLWAEKFKEAFDVKRSGDSIKISIRIGIT